jgi:hypothetical protein
VVARQEPQRELYRADIRLPRELPGAETFPGVEWRAPGDAVTVTLAAGAGQRMKGRASSPDGEDAEVVRK